MAHPGVDLWWWLTRPCPGHKLLFRQPYLLWGVKGEPWITLRGPTLSKHWLLSDDRASWRGQVLFPGAGLSCSPHHSSVQRRFRGDTPGGFPTVAAYIRRALCFPHPYCCVSWVSTKTDERGFAHELSLSLQSHCTVFISKWKQPLRHHVA